jgi:hypothetical protein
MSKWLLDQFFLNPLMCFLPYNLHTHTHTHTHPITHISGICRITINVLTFLSYYPIHCLPNNTNQLHAHSTLCMSRCVTRRHFSPNASFHTSQVGGHSTFMYVLMSYQIALVNECLITNITTIRAFTTMYVSMSYQTALVTECLITRITSKRALTTMYALMS